MDQTGDSRDMLYPILVTTVGEDSTYNICMYIIKAATCTVDIMVSKKLSFLY